MVSPNDCPEFLKWMPGEDQILIFEENVSKASQILQNAQLIFTLDFNALHRVGEAMYSVLKDLHVDYIMIDHHEQPDAYAKFTYF